MSLHNIAPEIASVDRYDVLCVKRAQLLSFPPLSGVVRTGVSFLGAPTPEQGRVSHTRPASVVNVARSPRCTRSCTRVNVYMACRRP